MENELQVGKVEYIHLKSTWCLLIHIFSIVWLELNNFNRLDKYLARFDILWCSYRWVIKSFMPPTYSTELQTKKKVISISTQVTRFATKFRNEFLFLVLHLAVLLHVQEQNNLKSSYWNYTNINNKSNNFDSYAKKLKRTKWHYNIHSQNELYLRVLLILLSSLKNHEFSLQNVLVLSSV